MYQEQLTQCLAVVGWKAPASLSGATDTSITDVDIAKYKRLLFIIFIGTNATSLAAKRCVSQAGNVNTALCYGS